MILPWSWQDSTRDLMTSFLSSKSLPNKGCVYICKYTSTHMHTHHKSMFSIRHTQPFFCQLCSPCITLKKKKKRLPWRWPVLWRADSSEHLEVSSGWRVWHPSCRFPPPSPLPLSVACVMFGDLVSGDHSGCVQRSMGRSQLQRFNCSDTEKMQLP